MRSPAHGPIPSKGKLPSPREIQESSEIPPCVDDVDLWDPAGSFVINEDPGGIEDLPNSAALDRPTAKERSLFVQWFQGSLSIKMKDPIIRHKLKKNHLLVLVNLVNSMKFRNQVTLSQRVIAENLGMPESRLSPLLTVLEDLDFLTRNHGLSRTFTLMMNPEFFLMGFKTNAGTIQEDYAALRESRLSTKGG